ncbi:MAG: Nif3-like dinuclear metal center hexameric protein, partial [bacterium]|nr:Nif3-like dinuclear metal center hexameric protein [bacterium]
MKRTELTKYLDAYLSTGETPDYPTAVNGLQVEGGTEVNSIMTAVDASLATIRAAAESRADMVLVHHGLFWPGLKPITGPYGEKLKILLTNAISLYSSHLPLDAHPEVGNNAGLLKLCGLTPKERFGDLKGVQIGYTAEADISVTALTERLSVGLHTCVKVVNAGDT